MWLAVQTGKSPKNPPLRARTGALPEQAYLTAHSVDFLWCLKGLLLQTREPAFIVHLKQLQGPAAIAHLHTGKEQREESRLSLSKPLLSCS